MERFNITLPKTLQQEIDAQAKKEKLNRSSLIRKAVYCYFQMKRKQGLHDLMKEGYQAEYGEVKKIQKDFRYVDQEAWKYVD